MKINYKKTYSFFMSALFIVFVGVMALANLIKKDEKFSDLENRYLSEMPQVSVGGVVSREYSEKVESYISDQFPGRNIFVAMKGSMDSLSGKKDRNGVFIGKSGQLLQDFKERSEEETTAKISAVNEFAERYSDLNISFMLIPTATKVLENELPKNAPVDDEKEYIDNFKGQLKESIKFIDTYEALKSSKSEKLYFRTDHHWTSRGAYEGYKELCKTLELEAKSEENFEIKPVTERFYGSLSSQIASEQGEADTIEVYFPKEGGETVVTYVEEQKKSPSLYDSSKLDDKDKYQVFTGGNHPRINIKSMGDPERKLLLIKDSYANAMVPFLIFNYGEIEVIDLRYFTEDLDKVIKSKGITDILFLYNVNTFNEDDSILNLEM
ncbi:DHHW family protein [Clostridium culturomicium]|uniref:DHHW family protein n=1 Tax=Clostridium culturomicium TaxID=1499683 RepID=UPI003857C84A